MGSSTAERCRKEKGGHGRKGGPGTHRGRGTLTPAGSPLPFPYTAAPASPGPAPASGGTAADRGEHWVSVAHNGLLSPPAPAKTAES